MTLSRPKNQSILLRIANHNLQEDNFHKFISNIDKQYSCDILAMNIHQERIFGDGEGYRPGDEKNREISYIHKNKL